MTEHAAIMTGHGIAGNGNRTSIGRTTTLAQSNCIHQLGHIQALLIQNLNKAKFHAISVTALSIVLY